MKTKLANNWPAIRQIAYGIGAIALGGSWLAGWITSDQLDAGLDQIEQLLGAAALLMAGLYVDRSKPAPEPEPAPEIPALDVIERIRAEGADRLGETLRAQARSVGAEFERARSESADRLDQFGDGVRAELERRLKG